jgi:hypothetical protein
LIFGVPPASPTVPTEPTSVNTPGVLAPPGSRTVTAAPCLARLWYFASRSAATTCSVPVTVSTAATTSSPTRTLCSATRSGPGVKTILPGSSAPVWGSPNAFCNLFTAEAVSAVNLSSARDRVWPSARRFSSNCRTSSPVLPTVNGR